MTESIGLLTADDRLKQALQDVLGRLPVRSRRQFVLERNGGRRRSHPRLSRLLIISWAKDLATSLSRSRAEDVSSRWASRWKGHLVFVGQDTPAETLSSLARLRVQDPSRLQFVTAADLEQARQHLGAFVQRLIHAGDSEGILHAWWSGEALEVLTTRFRRVGVPRASIASLEAASEEECRNLEVGYDGSHVAWPSVDVHLGFEQMEALVSPERALRRRQRSDDFNKRYGAAIRFVRQAHGLTQSSVPGLSPRHVGRIERGETRATSKALRSLARAHELAEPEYLEQVARTLARAR